ncbi:16000_t:CDS:1, partial [Racocetra persica]
EGIVEIVNYKFDEKEKEAKNNNNKDPSPLITITEAVEVLKK